MRIIIILAFIVASISASAQGRKCDIVVLAKTKAKIEKLTSNDIRIFLSVFSPSCKSNVEFSEFGNELLFQVIEKHTQKTLLILEKGYPEIQLASLLNVFENPLSDVTDLNYLIQKIEKSKAKEQLKKQIIDALNVSNNN